MAVPILTDLGPAPSPGPAHSAEASGKSSVGRNATALMLATVLTAVLGLAFWVVAARLFTPAEVGVSASTVSAMTLLAGLSQLNLTSVFVRFLPKAGRKTRLYVLRGYVGSVATAAALLLAFLWLGLGSSFLPSEPHTLLIFAVCTLLYSIFFVQDGALIGLDAAQWVPLENGVFAAVKLALLPLFAVASTGYGPFLAFGVPVVAGVGLVNLFLFGRLIPARHAAARDAPAADAPDRLPAGGSVGSVGSFVAAEYCNSILASLVSLLPPVIIARMLGSTAAAYLHMPWLLGTSFNVLLWNVASAFVAESARNDSDLRDHLRRTVRLGVATCLGGMVFLLAGAGLVLAVVGHQYAVEGATPLRIIALSFPFQAIVVLASAFAMLRQRMWVVVATQAATTALFLTLLTVLSRRVGLIGPATAYLIAQVFAATVLSPSLVGAVRSLVRSDHPRESW